MGKIFEKSGQGSISTKTFFYYFYAKILKIFIAKNTKKPINFFDDFEVSER